MIGHMLDAEIEKEGLNYEIEKEGLNYELVLRNADSQTDATPIPELDHQKSQGGMSPTFLR
jgi:hypothetical protein